MRKALWVLPLMLFTGCMLNEEHYRSVVEMPAKIEQLHAKDEELKKDLDALKEELRIMRKALEAEIQEQKVRIDRLSQGRIRITLPQEILFPSGSVRLTEKGRRVVAHVADGLKKTPADLHIHVVGHTDSLPVSKALGLRFKDNWELSAARAASVARALIWGEHVDAARIRIEGRADTEPVASNATVEGRRANRRIEIYLTRLD